MDAVDRLLPELLLPLAVGRLLLSLLPPGWPGDHDRKELGVTLLASWVLGRALGPLASWWWLWLPVAALRLATLPGGPRPGHRDGRTRGIAWAMALVALVGLELSGKAPGAAVGAALLAVAGWLYWRSRADRRGRALGILMTAALVPLLAILR